VQVYRHSCHVASKLARRGARIAVKCEQSLQRSTAVTLDAHS